jgi:Astacin (Peptidase family M12A)
LNVYLIILKLTKKGAIMKPSLTLFLKFFILYVFSQATPIVAIAHDLAGLKMVDSLPPEIAKKIKKNELLRTPAVRLEIIKAQNLSNAEAKKYLKSKGLPEQLASGFESIFSNTLWSQKHEIQICFLDGIDSARQKVIEAMQIIITETNLNLRPGIQNCNGSNGDIRVTFKLPGYSSYVGTDSLLIPYPKETLRLSSMDKGTWSAFESSAALHELMHAIGALHEHQNPQRKCQNEYDLSYIKSSLKMTDTEIRVNFLDIPENKIGAISAYDDKSIMHYQLSPKFFLKREASSCYIKNQNTVLSEGDIAMLNNLYPK